MHIKMSSAKWRPFCRRGDELNTAYKMACWGNHRWVQTAFKMSVNGFKENWFNPSNRKSSFHNVAKQHLRDHFFFTKLESNSTYFYPYMHWHECRFWLHEEIIYRHSDLPLYNSWVDSIQHVLSHWSYLEKKCDYLYENIELQLSWWRHMDDETKLNIYDIKTNTRSKIHKCQR